MLYRLLLERLPHAAIVSIGHRSSLVMFHERFLALKSDGKGRHRLTPVTPEEGARDADEMRLSLV
jgi:putative ATP-binding cassette transporter